MIFIMNKEEKDRYSDYCKEELKSRYELLRGLLWLIIVIGTGILGLGLSEDFNLNMQK